MSISFNFLFFFFSTLTVIHFLLLTTTVVVSSTSTAAEEEECTIPYILLGVPYNLPSGGRYSITSPEHQVKPYYYSDNNNNNDNSNNNNNDDSNDNNKSSNLIGGTVEMNMCGSGTDANNNDNNNTSTVSSYFLKLSDGNRNIYFDKRHPLLPLLPVQPYAYQNSNNILDGQNTFPSNYFAEQCPNARTVEYTSFSAIDRETQKDSTLGNEDTTQRIGFAMNFYSSMNYTSNNHHNSTDVDKDDNLQATVLFLCPNTTVFNATTTTTSSSPEILCEPSWQRVTNYAYDDKSPRTTSLVIYYSLSRDDPLCRSVEDCRKHAATVDDCSNTHGCYTNVMVNTLERVRMVNGTNDLNYWNTTEEMVCVPWWSTNRKDILATKTFSDNNNGDMTQKTSFQYGRAACILTPAAVAASSTDNDNLSPSDTADAFFNSFVKDLLVNVSAFSWLLASGNAKTPTDDPCNQLEKWPTIVIVVICTLILSFQMFVYGDFHRIVRHERLHVVVDALAVIGFSAAFVSVLVRTIPTDYEMSQKLSTGFIFAYQDVSFSVLPTWGEQAEMNRGVVSRSGASGTSIARISNTIASTFDNPAQGLFCRVDHLDVMYIWVLFGVFGVLCVLEFIFTLLFRTTDSVLGHIGRVGGAGSIWCVMFPPRQSSFLKAAAASASTGTNNNNNNHGNNGDDNRMLPGASSSSLLRISLRFIWCVLQVCVMLPVAIITTTEPHLFLLVAIRLWRVSEIGLRDILLPARIHANEVELTCDDAVVFTTSCRGALVLSWFAVKKFLAVVAWALLAAAALTFATPIFVPMAQLLISWTIMIFCSLFFCVLARILQTSRIVVRSGFPRPRIHYQQYSIVLPFLLHTSDITARVEEKTATAKKKNSTNNNYNIETCCEGKCYTIHAGDFIAPSSGDDINVDIGYHISGQFKRIFWSWFGNKQRLSVMINPRLRIHIKAESIDEANRFLRDLICDESTDSSSSSQTLQTSTTAAVATTTRSRNRNRFVVEAEDHDVSFCMQALSSQWRRFVRGDDPFFNPTKQEEMLHLALAKHPLDFDCWSQITASKNLEATDTRAIRQKLQAEVANSTMSKSERKKKNMNNNNSNSKMMQIAEEHSNDKSIASMKSTMTTASSSVATTKHQNENATVGEKILASTLVNRRIFLPLCYFFFLFQNTAIAVFFFGSPKLIEPLINAALCVILLVVHIALLQEDAASARRRFLCWVDVMMGSNCVALSQYQFSVLDLPNPQLSRSVVAGLSLYMMLFPVVDLCVSPRFGTIVQAVAVDEQDHNKSYTGIVSYLVHAVTGGKKGAGEESHSSQIEQDEKLIVTTTNDDEKPSPSSNADDETEEEEKSYTPADVAAHQEK